VTVSDTRRIRPSGSSVQREARTSQGPSLTEMTDADRRGPTPLSWTHVAAYGEVKLDMTSRRARRELSTL
jgi:hypothetical protein